MKVEIENLSEVKRKLRIEVPSAEVAQEVDQAYRDLGKKAKVKGFRPGKVPRPILELYYRKQVEQEVSDSLVRRYLGEVLKEKALEPMGLNWPEPPPPVVAGEDYRFSVELEVPPEFTVEDYLGLSLEAAAVEVGEAEVDQRLEEIREANALLRPAPEGRGIQAGDYVVLDYQGFFAGQPLAEGRAENYFLEVGAGKFDPEFERQLLGLTPGAESRFAASLSSDFFNPLLAGKEMEFQVKIHEVKEKVAAELDDHFAQNLGGKFQSLADLRAAVREDMIKVKERARQAGLEAQALEQLLARTSFEVPPSLVAQEQENILREQLGRMQQHGLNVAGLDAPKMMEAVKPSAERRVRVQLLLQQIADQEGMVVEDGDLEAGLARVAAQTGRDLEQMRQLYQEHDLMSGLARSLREEKTLELILKKATVALPDAAAAAEGQAREQD